MKARLLPAEAVKRHNGGTHAQRRFFGSARCEPCQQELRHGLGPDGRRGPGRSFADSQGGRDRLPHWALGLRQIDIVAHHIGPPAPDQRRGDVLRPTRHRPVRGHRDGVSKLRFVPVAGRARQCGDWPARPRRAARRSAQAGHRLHRHHRARRLRIGLSEGAIRRHAPACRLREGACRAAQDPTDGRTLLGA